MKKRNQKVLYKRRLLKLAKFLREKVPPRLLNMSGFIFEDEQGHKHSHASLSCGTPACALGWATAIFPELHYSRGMGSVVNHQGREAGLWFFGVTYDLTAWGHLFGARKRRTPKQEARVIETYVRNNL